MSVHLSVVLFFTGLTGLHSITTVSEVSVKAGGSISIPCLYESKYTHHVKYLCKGYGWVSCLYAVRTDGPASSQRFSISDDTDQRIFTVTINNLTHDDSDYWCAVEIKDGSDVGKYFKLSVTRVSLGLYVDHQEITGFHGGDVTINCYSSVSGEVGWCRLGGSCVTESSGSIDGTNVSISKNVSSVFTVTMRGLRTQSSGWYLCVRGDRQMPVHLTVLVRPSTTTRYLTTTILAPVKSEYHGLSVYLLSLVLSLSVCVIVATVIWVSLKRHSQNLALSSPAAVAPVCNVEVTYRSVVTRNPRARQMQGPDEVVIYSALAPQ